MTHKDDDEGLDEFSLLDDVDLDEAFAEPVDIEPLVLETSRPAQPADAEAIAEAFAAIGALKLCEEVLPPALGRGVMNRMTLDAAVAAALNDGDIASRLELLEALYHARERTRPGIGLALQSHQILLRPLPVLAGQELTAISCLTRLLDHHLEIEVPAPLAGPDPVAALAAVESVLEQADGHKKRTHGPDPRTFTLPKAVAAAIEARALVVALDLKRPLLPPIERHLDLTRAYTDIVGARAGLAVGQYKRLFAKWQDRPALTRTGKETVLRRMADLALEQPAVSVPSAMQFLEISKPAATKALDQLEKDGFLQEITGQRGWRIWRA